jgi:hypothetical protein
MAVLTYTAVNGVWNWTGTVNINYTTVYDQDTNQTTVTFEDCSHVYFGRNLYSTSYNTEITVTADDNPSSKGTATIISANNATTNGGVKTFTDTPSPVSIVVKHSPEAGKKTITISGTTSVTVYMTSSTSTQATGTGSGSMTVITGEQLGLAYIDNGSSIESYQIYVDTGAGWVRVIPYVDYGSQFKLCT